VQFPDAMKKRPRERCQAPPATGPPNAERTWRGFPPTIVYSGGTPWTCKHEEWLRRHRFDAVLAATAARDRLDEQILVVAASPRFADPVNRLGCLRGISALTGLALTVEIGDWSRFTGSSIGAYVGLVPSEFASGTSASPGVDHQGRQHPRETPADRIGLASSQVRQPIARPARLTPALRSIHDAAYGRDGADRKLRSRLARSAATSQSAATTPPGSIR